MSVVYLLVSRGAVVQTEYTQNKFKGNFQTAAVRLLQEVVKQPNIPSEMSYMISEEQAQAALSPETDASQRYAFHYIHRSGLICLAICSLVFPRQQAYTMLDEVYRSFVGMFGVRWEHANAYDLNKDFHRTLLAIGERYEHNHRASGDKALANVKNQIADVTTIISDNIKVALERGEHLESLLDKTDDLTETSTTFRKKTQVVRRKMWWSLARVWVLIAVIVVIVIYIGVSVGCGGPSWPKCV